MALELRVEAGMHHRESCPVKATIELEKLGSDWKDVKSCTLTDDKEVKTPGQCELSADGKSMTISWILDNLKTEDVKKYTLSPEECESLMVEFDHFDDDHVDVSVWGEMFTTYRYNKEQLKPYLNPVIGPFGHTVTRGETSPEGHRHDHIHHRSIWVSYGEVNEQDFWSEGENAGRQLHKDFEKLVTGPVFGEIFANNEWISRDGSEKIVDESRDMVFYNLPSSQRIIDMTVHFRASHGDAFFGDTKEAGLISVRVYPTMTVSPPGTGKIENAIGGIGESETWGKMAQWCDYSGVVNGNKVGITVFDHPKNFRYPTYWHVRNYGLMTANIFGRGTFEGDPAKDGSWTLKDGETLTMNYRIYIHPGDAKDGKVKEKYHDYINPPAVKIV
ncbi:hypothetical protein GF312_15600 [Candidatus Poribacteria bacterium]|nr:hypothetical protein [Candidatus Poribacteria bacterium]